MPFIKNVVDLAAVKMSRAMLLGIASAVVFVLSAGLTFGWCYARAHPGASKLEVQPQETQNHTALLVGSFSAMAASSSNGLADPRAAPHLPSAKSPASSANLPGFKNPGGREPVSTTLPARPLKQVMPNLGMLASSLPSVPTDVEVAIRIDERGRVTGARVVNQGSREDPFANAALAAAKEWIFEPAKLHGETVPSDHLLEFHFHPQLGQQSVPPTR